MKDYLGPVHGWFGLTYSSYAVLQRSLLQGMPADWQERFVQLMKEMDQAYDVQDLPDFWIRAKRDNKFVQDPYSNYRHPPPLPYKVKP